MEHYKLDKLGATKFFNRGSRSIRRWISPKGSTEGIGKPKFHVEEDDVLKRVNLRLLTNKHLNKENPKDRLLRGHLLYLRGRKSEALADYEAVLTVDPTNELAKKGVENCTKT
jgi:hypothetical protein